MNYPSACNLMSAAGYRLASPLGRSWKDYSRLILVGDQGGWVLDEEIRDLRSICGKIGLRTVAGGWEPVTRRQCAFYASQFILLNPRVERGHRSCFAYFHGKPDCGVPEFDEVFANLRRTHERWARIQVSHSEMRQVVLSSGIAKEKVHVIPIGIRLGMFPQVTAETRAKVRARLEIPEAAFVVGSFQKDGCGWGEGLEPKLIKGPDILVETLRRVKERIPEVFVLLSGPARGFVKRGLEAAGIPCHHVCYKKYSSVAGLYSALDLYLVTARQEGGPKAVLEAMASGVPLVTTRVGQAMDLVEPGKNALMQAVEDVDGLVYAVQQVYELSSQDKDRLVTAGRQTAEAHAWEQQGPLWQQFFKGVIE